MLQRLEFKLTFMRIQRLELHNFRNYRQLVLPFNKQMIVFLGNNAQGKTNLLESIYMSAMGKSHRANQDTDLIQWKEPAGIIRLDFESRQMAHQIEISITPSEKRIKKDGKMISKRSELFGHLAMVLFTPDDLSLIKGEPSLRRRFLDLEISQTRPVYLHALQRYYRALKQRNISIRNVLAKKAGLDLVHAWDDQLVEFGSQIMS
jgi:DNA replication and repair protein RecF